MGKKLTQEEQILADVDDEIALLYERIKLKYDLSLAKARDAVNKALRTLMVTEKEFFKTKRKKKKMKQNKFNKYGEK